MKTSFISRFLVICLGFMPIQATAQLVLPVEPAVLHYKNWNNRILSHGILQTIPLVNGDTLYRSYPSLVDTTVIFSCIQYVIPSTGFPLGNELTKKVNGHWTSLTRDSILLQWEFTAIPQHSWTVFQDSSNQLNGEFVGIDTINHFSGPLTIWKFKLSNDGTKFSDLDNRQIWLSDYGILLSPDIRAFPYEKTEVILTGYDSRAIKKGLHFNDATYAPFGVGDTLVLYHLEQEANGLNFQHKIYYNVHHLTRLLSSSATNQIWEANTRSYTMVEDEISSETNWSYDTIQLAILPYDNGRIISLYNNQVYLITDSLPFEQNPDYAFERTYAQSYSLYANTLHYMFKLCSFGSQSFSIKYSTYRSDWGFQLFKHETHSFHDGNYEPYTKERINATYLTVGNRHWGTPPPTPTAPPVSAPIYILSYPNPTANSLTIVDKTMDDKWVNVNVYNTEGRLVLQFEGRFPIQFDLADFKAGLYSARLSDTNGYNKYTRFVKINP